MEESKSIAWDWGVDNSKWEALSVGLPKSQTQGERPDETETRVAESGVGEGPEVTLLGSGVVSF